MKSVQAWTAIRKLVLSPPFLRSILVSAAATGSDFVVANALARAHAAPAFATFTGCAVGGVVAFTANRNWAFKVHGRAVPQILRFLFVWATSAALNSAGVPLLLAFFPALGFAWVWMLVRGTVYGAWNFPLLRMFVFRAAPISDAGRRS